MKKILMMLLFLTFAPSVKAEETKAPAGGEQVTLFDMAEAGKIDNKNTLEDEEVKAEDAEAEKSEVKVDVTVKSGGNTTTSSPSDTKDGVKVATITEDNKLKAVGRGFWVKNRTKYDLTFWGKKNRREDTYDEVLGKSQDVFLKVGKPADQAFLSFRGPRFLGFLWRRYKKEISVSFASGRDDEQHTIILRDK